MAALFQVNLNVRYRQHMVNRAGYFKKNLAGEMQYESYVPNPLPPTPPLALTDDSLQVLVEARSNLAVLDNMAVNIPSVSLFISMYVRKEALLSSQIEGTQATLEDVMDPNVQDNANHDVSDVVNNIKATNFAISQNKNLPLCNRLFKQTHAVLMQGVRGQEKNPGEFRRSQNWIGAAGSTLKKASYIPPCPEDMVLAMSDLEKYINAENTTDPLVSAALIHYQFETIHPFLDGNGRVGRLLVTLFLLQQKVLSSPVLYISYVLKKNRVEYYDRMSEVRRKGNYEQWVNFFLKVVLETAQDGIGTIKKLIALHDKNDKKINNMGRASKTAKCLFKYLEEHPIIEVKKTAVELEMSYNTVSSAIKRLVDVGILEQTTKNARNRTFAYEDYLAIFRKGTLL